MHGCPPALRAQEFPRAISFSAAFSSSASANSRLSGAFSRSGSFRPLGVIGLKTTELIAPAVVGLLGDLQFAAYVGAPLGGPAPYCSSGPRRRRRSTLPPSPRRHPRHGRNGAPATLARPRAVLMLRFGDWGK